MPLSKSIDFTKYEDEEQIQKILDGDTIFVREIAQLIEHYNTYKKILRNYHHLQKSCLFSPTIRIEFLIPRFVFILGMQGSGKTLLTLKFCEGFPNCSRYLNCIETPDAQVLSIINWLSSLMVQEAHAIFILVIDDIDVLADDNCKLGKKRRELIYSVLDLLSRKHTSKLSCEPQAGLDVTRVYSIDMDIADSKSRAKNLRKSIQRLPVDENCIDEIVSVLTKKIHRLQRVDIQILCRNSYINYKIRSTNGLGGGKMNIDDFLQAATTVLPTQVLHLTSNVPYITLKSMYGLEDIIAYLSGLFIYGPSGVGKTSLGYAIANELGFASINIDGATVRSKVVGDSEKNIASIFSTANSYSPCTLIIDNIESLIPPRGSDYTSERTSERIVSAFLTEIDGIFSNRTPNKRVFIIAVSSCPKNVDSAILRAGRIGEHIFIPLPSISTRVNIFKGFMSGIPHLLNNDNWIKLADMAEGFTGAQIKRACNNAVISACIRDIRNDKRVTLEDILNSIDELKYSD